MPSKTVLYYITFQCNDTCEFCPIWDNKELKKIEEAPIEKHFENLRSARLSGGETLEVTGGEPLMYQALPDFLRRAKDLGLKINLNTNGILYPERANELKGLTDKIYFALDYPIQEEHDRSRGLACFNTALSAIRLAKQLKESPIIDFTITRDSVRFLPEMVELSQRTGVNVRVSPVYDFQGLQGFEPATYGHIKYYFKRKNIFINLAELEFLKKHGNNVAWPRCMARQTTITYLSDGRKVSPCFFNQGGKQGRESVCYGCTRWPYMLPSFKIGFDKYRFLDWYSNWLNGRKPPASRG